MKIETSFKNLSKALLRAFRKSLQIPGLVAFVSLLVLATAIFGLPKSRTILAMDDLVDETFQSRHNLDKLYADFNVRQSLLLVIESPISGFHSDFLCDLKSWITQQRLSNHDMISSMTIFDLRSSLFKDDVLRYPLMVDPDCDVKTEKLWNLKDAARSPWGISLTNLESNILLVHIDLHEAPAESRLGSFDPASIRNIHQSFNNAIGNKYSAMRTYWVGPSDFQYHMYKGLGRVSQLNLLMLFVLIFLLRAFFGTWRAGFIFVGCILFCGVVLFGFMAWCGIPVDILSKSLFLIVAVSTLEDFVFISTSQLQQSQSESQWRKPFRVMLVPGFLTSLTSVFGFGSLCISDLLIIRRFGFWASIGALLEWLILFFVLPSILSKVKSWRSWVNPEKIWIKIRFLERDIRVSKRVALGALGIYIVAAYGVFHLKISDVPLDMFAKDHSFRVGSDVLKKRLGWETMVNLVFEDGDDQSTNVKILDQIKTLENVAGIESPYGMIDFLTQGQPPLTQDLTARGFKMTELYHSLHAFSGRTRALVFVKDSELMAVETLKRKIESLCGDRCFLAGGVLPYSEFAQKVPKTLLESFSISLLLVGGIILWLALALKKKNILALLASSCWGTMVMVVIVSATQMNINFLTCVFASILVGLTGDNAIQYLCASHKRGLAVGLEKRGGASIVCSAIMALASLVFLGSYFVPPRIFGIMLSTGLVLALFGDFWILRGLVEGEK